MKIKDKKLKIEAKINDYIFRVRDKIIKILKI